MNDYTLIIWIAALILVGIMVFLIVKLAKESRQGDIKNPGAPPPVISPNSNGRVLVSPGAGSRGTGAVPLHIPKEMLQNESSKPGSLSRNNDAEKGTDSGPTVEKGIISIYRYQEKNMRQICPLCETENRMDADTCVLCGTRLRK